MVIQWDEPESPNGQVTVSWFFFRLLCKKNVIQSEMLSEIFKLSRISYYKNYKVTIIFGNIS